MFVCLFVLMAELWRMCLSGRDTFQETAIVLLNHGGLCHSDSNKHKEKLKDVESILGVKQIGLVNKLNVRNEEKWDSIKYQMDGVATQQTRRSCKRN